MGTKRLKDKNLILDTATQLSTTQGVLSSFVPTFETAGTASFTTIAQSGFYCQIGKMVITQFQVTFNLTSKGTGSGRFFIKGFPAGMNSQTVGNPSNTTLYLRNSMPQAKGPFTGLPTGNTSFVPTGVSDVISPGIDGTCCFKVYGLGVNNSDYDLTAAYMNTGIYFFEGSLIYYLA